MMNRIGILGLSAALAAVSVTGCATKNYVHNKTAPLIDQTNQLGDKTAANTRQIREVNSQAQTGIKNAQNAADTATQNAQNASKEAGKAQMEADNAVHRADSLESVIKGLDQYRPAGNVTVNFGFNKSTLTKEAKEELDNFAAKITSKSNYILEVTGGTDSTGPVQYNYQLSQRRADSVVQYLATMYGIPAHRFYLIGIGEEKEVASNKTAAGRRENRRVTVQMLTNAPSTPKTQASGASQGGM